MWKNENGVAMITVLVVAAVLTAVTSTASFVAIRELGATRADSSSAQALAYAEAGIDRLMLEIRSGNAITWNDISLAGCDADHPVITRTGSIGTGTYRTTLEVYNRQASAPADRFRPSACTSASSSPIGTRSFLISSLGEQPAPTARKVIRQVIDIKPLGLPIGAYAYERIDANGTVNMQNASMVTEGVVTNRDNIGFRGLDPYYTIKSFYGDRVDDVVGAKRMPAAVHAKNAITYGPASKNVEHRTGFEPNCEANPKGKTGQSLWDGSGTATIATLTATCAAWTGAGEVASDGSEGALLTAPPTTAPTAQFTEADRSRVAPVTRLSDEEYLTLKQSARSTGLYCRARSGLPTDLECSEAGGAFLALTANRLDSSYMDHPSIPRSFVVYIEFNNDGLDPFLKKVNWAGSTNIGPCSPAPLDNRTGVIIVRHGSFDSSGTSYINGAMLLPEGQFESTGTFTLEGTIIVRRIVNLGTVTIRLSSCWISNLPGPWLDVTPVSWSEVDR